LKKQGRYEELREALDVILSTEDQMMMKLLGLDEVIHKAKTASEQQTRQLSKSDEAI
jgi:hypothetical protein